MAWLNKHMTFKSLIFKNPLVGYTISLGLIMDCFYLSLWFDLLDVCWFYQCDLVLIASKVDVLTGADSAELAVKAGGGQGKGPNL